MPTTAPDLRTQLKLAESGADVVNSVSIFGTRDVENGQVKKFDLWSLDWTPKGRAGMETDLLAVSSEQANKEEDDMTLTREEVIASLKADEVPKHLVEGIQKDALDGVSGKAALADKVRLILGLEESDTDKILDRVTELVVAKATASLDETLDEVLKDTVKAEMARAAVKDAIRPSLSVKSTTDEIKGEIDKALERPYIKSLVDGGTIPVFSGGGSVTDENRQSTVWE